MKKKVLLFLLSAISVTLIAQTELKLEIVPKTGNEGKLNEELWLEAWLTNTTSSEIKVFKIGNSEPDWEGFQDNWKMEKNGVEVKLNKFRDAATSKFSEALILSVAPGTKIYAGLLRKKIEESGKYRIEYKLSADPNKVNLNYASNPNSKERAKQITNFTAYAVYEFEIKGYEFDKVNVERKEITDTELQAKPKLSLIDAFNNPSEVYKLEITGKISPENLAQIYKFQNVRELELTDLEGIEELPVNLSTLDLRKIYFTNINTKVYPIEYGNWTNMKEISFHPLKGDFPKFINKLVNLEEFYMQSETLSEIPLGLGNMKKLKIITIEGNGQNLKLNNDICGLPALEQLAISKLKLTEFPAVWGSTSLWKVSLIETDLNVIGDSISYLVKLQDIFIQNAKLNSLPQGFSELKNLKSVSFSNNEFTVFPTVLYTCSSLSYIDFSNNKISKMDDGIDKMQNLSTLTFQQNQVTELPVGLSKCPKLKIVNVKGNRGNISGKEKKLVQKKLGAKYFE